MPTEGSAGSAGREASRSEQSERGVEGQVSSAKQFAIGAKRGSQARRNLSQAPTTREVLNTERSAGSIGRETPRTEQSGNGAEGQVSSAE